MSASRDLHREHAFLDEAAHGHQPFVDQAQARLTAGDEHYGDSWAWIGIRKHLTELLEEAADLGAWAALAQQALDLDHALTERQRQQLRATLKTAARSGAQAHAALTNALLSLEAPSSKASA